MISRQDRRPQTELKASVDLLRDEVRVLRDVLDEIRDALQWQNKNAMDIPALSEHRSATCSLGEATLPLPPDGGVTSEAPVDVASTFHKTPGKQRHFL